MDAGSGGDDFLIGVGASASGDEDGLQVQVEPQAQGPQPEENQQNAGVQQAGPALLLETVFGVNPDLYTLPVFKSVLRALGIGGGSHLRRDEIVDVLQAAETSATIEQRRTIKYLIESKREITRASIAAGIPPKLSIPRTSFKKNAKGDRTRDCLICIEDKAIEEFPDATQIGCKHASYICNQCWTSYINAKLSEVTIWYPINCILCATQLPMTTVEKFAEPAKYVEYRIWMATYQMSEVKNFRWCTNPLCIHGQVHPHVTTSDSGRVICYVCGFESCFHCQIPYHMNMTCKASVKERLKQMKPDEASKLMISSTTNVCPRCKADIQRAGGCSHMTCVCGAPFLWKEPDSIIKFMAKKNDKF